VPGITPAQREPHKGSKFLSQLVGNRVREARSLHDNLSQQEVADRMELPGHKWVRQTVARIESAERNLTVDELVSVAIALQTSVAYLLSPASPADPYTSMSVDIGGPDTLDLDQLSSLLGFRPDPFPRAWGYYEWPDMDFKVAHGWDEVRWGAEAEDWIDQAEGRANEQ